MGNRAVITTKCGDAQKSDNLGVYLHWNGGRDSVEAFLAYCKLKEYRSPDDDCYGWARLCQVVGNFFGGSTSLGIDTCKNLDCNNFDNGVYIIEDWKIIGRQFYKGKEQQEYTLHEMLTSINESQPTGEQLEQNIIDEYCNIKLKIPEKTIAEGEIFKGVKTFSDLKQQYRELSQIHHPDKGGNEETMKLINKEYRAMKAKLSKEMER